MIITREILEECITNFLDILNGNSINTFLDLIPHADKKALDYAGSRGTVAVYTGYPADENTHTIRYSDTAQGLVEPIGFDVNVLSDDCRLLITAPEMIPGYQTSQSPINPDVEGNIRQRKKLEGVELAKVKEELRALVPSP